VASSASAILNTRARVAEKIKIVMKFFCAIFTIPSDRYRIHFATHLQSVLCTCNRNF